MRRSVPFGTFTRMRIQFPKCARRPLVLSEILGPVEGVQWGVLFAAVTVQLIPILIFVISVQRFIMAGLTAGSVKG